MKRGLAFAIGSVAVMLPASASSQDVITSASQSMAVSSIIQNFRDAVSSLINNADDAVSANTFRTRQHLEILLGQIDTMAQGTVDKTFGQLTAAEQQAFKDVGNQIYQLQNLEHVTAKDAKDSTYAVATALDKLPFVKGTPMVMEYAPLYVTSKSPSDTSNVPITIRGVSLGAEEPTYTVGGKPCAKIAQISTSITFNCPAALFAATANVTPVVGELAIPRTLTWWEKVKGWFGDKAPLQHYTLNVNVIPTTLGAYTVKAIVSTQTVKTQNRSQDFKDGNGHCDGTRTKSFVFNASPTWSIYSNSVHVQCDSSTSSRCLGVQNIAEKSFEFLTKIANHGSCGPFWKDARGTVWGTASWTEYQSIDGTAQQDAGSGNLLWGKAVQVKLPDNVQSVSVAVQQIDGREPIVIDGDAKSPWFETEYQKATRLLIIRPKPLADAMNS